MSKQEAMESYVSELKQVGISDLFRLFSKGLGGFKLSNNRCDLSIIDSETFLQQLKQMHEHIILKLKFSSQLCSNFVETLKSWNLLNLIRKNQSSFDENIRNFVKKQGFLIGLIS